MTPHNDHPRNYSKAALVLAAGALLISAGNAGVPAIARAIVTNSDKVDGLHAVKAGASVQQRKGKLVATSRTTGRLPNNIIKVAPDARMLGGQPAADYATKEPTFSLELDSLLLVPTNEDQYFVVRGATLRLPADGKVRLSMAYYLRITCDDVSTVATWLTVDGVYVPNAHWQFEPSATQMTTAVLEGITASPLAAGDHEVEVRAGCLSTTKDSVASYPPARIFATLLRNGAPAVSRVVTGAEVPRQCVLRVGGRHTCG